MPAALGRLNQATPRSPTQIEANQPGELPAQPAVADLPGNTQPTVIERASRLFANLPARPTGAAVEGIIGEVACSLGGVSFSAGSGAIIGAKLDNLDMSFSANKLPYLAMASGAALCIAALPLLHRSRAHFASILNSRTIHVEGHDFPRPRNTVTTAESTPVSTPRIMPAAPFRPAVELPDDVV